jgi:hypothetical protein
MHPVWVGCGCRPVFANGVDTRTNGVNIFWDTVWIMKTADLISVAANFSDLNIDEIHSSKLNKFTLRPILPGLPQSCCSGLQIGLNVLYSHKFEFTAA